MFKWLEKYFTFSRMERNAVVALLALSLLALVAPRIYFYFKPVQHADNSKYKQEIDAFLNGNSAMPEDVVDTANSGKNSLVATADTAQLNKVRKRQSAYFDFDPNKIGAEEWMRLGFSEKQAQSIEKYKEKGGRFYRPQDLMHLYVMDEEHYLKLKPFVKIDVAALPKRNYERY